MTVSELKKILSNSNYLMIGVLVFIALGLIFDDTALENVFLILTWICIIGIWRPIILRLIKRIKGRDNTNSY